jgi:S-DNA-T family DNA segregation ATPase FtsK/SpoIIIE
MAKKETKKEIQKDRQRRRSHEAGENQSFFERISKDTWNAILGVTSIVVMIFLVMAALGKGGPVGVWTYGALTYLFGIGYYLLPVAFALLAVSSFRALEKDFALPQTLGAFLFFASSLGLVDLLSTNSGGIVGGFISHPLFLLFDFYLSLIILLAFVIISFMVIFDTAIKLDLVALWRRIFNKTELLSTEDLAAGETDKINKAVEDLATKQPQPAEEREPNVKKFFAKSEESEGFTPLIIRRSGKEWNPPPLSLLEKDKGKPGVGDIKANANLIKRTLANFGIVVEMDEISIGPSATRYAVKPAEGVRLSKILALQQNLELALAAKGGIRIEAPIPGKSLVGIEVPNTFKATIGLGSLLSEKGYTESDKPLLASLGRDISGNSHFANIAKMPHALIAGATGSGKSVTIHAIVTSLLYRNPPENLKFLMIDPKRVELTLYNKIPHLLTPVITDAKKAILALKWTAKEMDRRYDILEKAAVRDIDSYHKTILAPAMAKSPEDAEGPDPMPYIVVIIDELADLMHSYPRELEASIVRLAQMSRAVGIHLLLSTQRPSVNVITGLIKANVPSRIALQVASQIDSRTIIDMAGAEKLLGAGDMLFLSGDMAKPVRIQSAYISENEVKKVVKYLVDEYADELNTGIDFTTENTSNAIFSATLDDGGDDDELYEEARATVLEAGKASTSYLQRKLRIGYARAARLIDILEERGVIGPGSGAKPRDVIGASSQAQGFAEQEPNDVA